MSNLGMNQSEGYRDRSKVNRKEGVRPDHSKVNIVRRETTEHSIDLLSRVHVRVGVDVPIDILHTCTETKARDSEWERC